MTRPLPMGIYTPLPTFFDANEDLDLGAFKAHIKYTTLAGTIPVIAEERIILIKAARETLDENGLQNVPIVAGAGASSTRESILLASQAASAGADFVMVIPPGYYASTLIANHSSLIRFFVDVASASPIPVIDYNFPSVSGGIDLDSEMVIEIVKRSNNVAGVKLTCASVGKIIRITGMTENPEFRRKWPRKWAVNEAVGVTGWGYFRVIDGYIDILMPSIASGAAGAISGLPNFAPRSCTKLWSLASSFPSPGSRDYLEARRLQNLTAATDGFTQKIGFAGVKFILNHLFGYGKGLRQPLMGMSDERREEVLDNEAFRRIMVEEKRLENEG
ncbi:putative dihydrodipicolinate synthase [Amniculicola lignicola CBS 123094]|uniref:Putative dihydrodipicolinate synthase n=1 Tax=Amniculicola lignicola CBS 123094 TaxID=1392246 RepID=A0A6A5WIA7_9PLEO|nr:putative dihydrodipicolinate synthase [Amniculicola lignicola CBS 123094]